MQGQELSPTADLKELEEGAVTPAWKDSFVRSELERLNDLQSRVPASSTQTHREVMGSEYMDLCPLSLWSSAKVLFDPTQPESRETLMWFM